MDNFVFCSPTEFVFGRDTEKQVGELVVRYGATKVMIVFGGGSAVRSGLVGRVTDSLELKQVPYVTLSGVQPNPLDTKVYEGIDLARKEKVDFMLAIGGGSVIDTAKAIALGVPYDGDFWDFYCGKQTPQKALPVGDVLTIAAAGSEASGNTVITKSDGMVKLSLKTMFVLRPKFSIMNPELTYTLPSYQTAAGIVDMMTHVYERYFTNTTECEVTDRECEGLLKSIIKEAPIVMKYPRNYEARANLMWAGSMAHGGICGVGREEDWSSHHMEHEISALYGVTHGVGLSVVGPARLEYLVDYKAEKLAQFARRVWRVRISQDYREMARGGIECMRRFYRELGMPLTFKDLGIENPDIDTLVDNLHKNKGEVIGEFKSLTREDTRKIFELCL